MKWYELLIAAPVMTLFLPFALLGILMIKISRWRNHVQYNNSNDVMQVLSENSPELLTGWQIIKLVEAKRGPEWYKHLSIAELYETLDKLLKQDKVTRQSNGSHFVWGIK